MGKRSPEFENLPPHVWDILTNRRVQSDLRADARAVARRFGLNEQEEEQLVRASNKGRELFEPYMRSAERATEMIVAFGGDPGMFSRMTDAELLDAADLAAKEADNLETVRSWLGRRILGRFGREAADGRRQALAPVARALREELARRAEGDPRHEGFSAALASVERLVRDAAGPQR